MEAFVLLPTSGTHSKPRKSQPKVKFTVEEDLVLRQLVEEYGDESWIAISCAMGNRTPRQVRERWRNYLSPSVNRDIWTDEEDRLLIEKYRIMGPKWKKMTEFFKNRTYINIKNHFMVLYRKMKKETDGRRKIDYSKVRKTRFEGQHNYFDWIDETKLGIVSPESIFLSSESQITCIFHDWV